MSTIFLVMGGTDYEGSTPLRAFSESADAERFAQKCRDYDATYIDCPEQDATDKQWDRWQRKERKWQAAHPASTHSRYDSYFVYEIDLHQGSIASSTVNPA